VVGRDLGENRYPAAINYRGQVAGQTSGTKVFITDTDGANPREVLLPEQPTSITFKGMSYSGRILLTGVVSEPSRKRVWYLTGPNGGSATETLGQGLSENGRIFAADWIDRRRDGGWQVPPELSGSSAIYPYGANRFGQITGYAHMRDSTQVMFITAADGGNPRSLGDGTASAINDSGQIAGWLSSGHGTNEAFVSAANGGEKTKLGMCGSSDYDTSRAEAINAFGVVLGRCGRWNGGAAGTTAISQSGKAFVSFSSVVDANPGEGWSDFAAVAINDRGEIAGTAKKAGKTHGVIFKPKRLATN
jgi:hypothetical protein